MGFADDLDLFVQIVDAGSISAAAREAGVPRATLSRRMAAMEEALGVRLLHRSTRQLLPTPQGDALLVRARRIVADTQAAREAVLRTDDVPRGILRVSTPPGVGPTGRTTWLTGFLERWPEVSVQIVESARHVDLRAEGFDVALRGGRVRDPSLIARTLARSRQLVVASPDYLARHGCPEHPDDLAHHQIVRDFAGGDQPRTHWPLRGGGSVAVDGRVSANALGPILDAARAGLGLALAPDLAIQADLDAGRLVPVLEDEVGMEGTLSVVYPDRAHLAPRVRAFVDWMVEHTEALLDAWAVSLT